MAQNLADLGADVIKVERPHEGDETRSFPPFIEGEDGLAESAYFSSINRGKRSITVDFSKPDGRDLVLDLIAKADVVVENYKFGTLARYGLDYESVQRINEKIIYCSITGFGQTGPYRERPGYDYVFQAMSGLMSLTGGPDHLPGGGPAKVGVAITDVLTGIYSAFAVTAALFHRERTGEGQYIDMSLLDVAIAAISHINMNYLFGKVIPKRMGTAHPSIVPYQAFGCTDGELVVAVGNNLLFRRLCDCIGRPDLVDDPRFADNSRRVENRDALVPILVDLFATDKVATWIENLTAAQVPCAPINTLAQVFDDPHVRARGMRQELYHPRLGAAPTLANPIRFSKTPVRYQRPPPLLGEHTEEVLRIDLGLSAENIAVLAKRGVI
jgi:formyl-CoA transferase